MSPRPPDDDELDPSGSFELSQARPFDDDEIVDIEGQQLLARLESALFGHEPEPQRLGRWVILERIGAGGMGVVYAAYDPRLDRRVALKVLRAGRGDHQDAHTRMLREAQALARISDPHVVQVHDVETLDDDICLVMELVAGPTLRQWQAEPRPPREILERYVKVAHGLARIHDAGLVHRDVKPDNVLLAGDRVVIADFGLVFADAAHPGGNGAPLRGAQPTALELSVTAEGALVGTLGYMAPEQLAGSAVSPKSDQFGFFVSLYEALTGMRPFRGKTPTEIVDAMLAGLPPRAQSGVPLPRWLHAVLRRGLAADPDDRFPSMAEVERALRRGLGRGRRARAVALVLVGLVVIGWYGLHERTTEDPCLEPPAELVRIWGADRRTELHAQLGAIGDPVREAAWQDLQAALDRAAERWSSAWQADCRERRAPVITPEGRFLAVARAACVGDVRSELEGFSHELSRSTTVSTESVRALIAALDEQDDCNDPLVLAQYQLILGLEQEPTEAHELRDALGKAHAREILGDYHEAEQRALEVARKANAAGLERMRAHAAYRRGRAASQLGRQEEARASLQEAVELASANHDHLLAAMASIFLAKMRADDPLGGRAGRGWLLLASTQLRAAGRHETQDWLWADFLDACGMVEQASRNYERAEQLHRRALELRTILAAGKDHPEVVRSENNLANVLSRLGPERKDEALRLYEHARESVVSMYGDEHPFNADLWINIGIQHDHAGRPMQAAEAFHAAVRIDRKVRGSSGLPALRALRLLGKLAADGEDQAQLDAIAEQIGAIHARLPASDPKAMEDADRAVELQIIAQARADDDMPAAIAALERAADILEPLDPVEHAWALVDLAQLEDAEGRTAEARALLERALSVLRSDKDPVDANQLAAAEALLQDLRDR